MILNSAKNKTKSADLGSKNGPPKNLAPPSADSTINRKLIKRDAALEKRIAQ